MIQRTAIPDYHRISCGCCTGRTIDASDGYGGWRLAEDQCVCRMHADIPRGIRPRQCSVHAVVDGGDSLPTRHGEWDPPYGRRMDSADMGEC